MRILIATVTAGGGHVQAGAALEEAWPPPGAPRADAVNRFQPPLALGRPRAAENICRKVLQCLARRNGLFPSSEYSPLDPIAAMNPRSRHA